MCFDIIILQPSSLYWNRGVFLSQKDLTPQHSLGTRPIKGMIWTFAIPGIISSLVNAIYNIVDQIFIGWGIGELGIAATTVTFPLATTITALAALLGMGGAARFNLSTGEGDLERARKILGNGLFLMVSFGSLIGILTILFLDPLLYAFGATEAIMPYAKPYGLIVSIGIPFGICATGASYFIRADGNPNYSSAVLLSGAIFNIVFDPIFLFVFDMGIAGIALATILGQMLSFVVALYYLLRKFKAVRLSKRDFIPSQMITKKILSLGVAPCFTHLAATAVHILKSNLFRYYGALSIYGSEIPLAAAGAVSKVMIVFMSCVTGIALGCQPIYSYNYGNKQYRRVKETYLLAVRYGSTISIVAFLCFQLFPRQILAIFGSSDPMFYEFAIQYFRIFLFMTFINALQPISSNFFHFHRKGQTRILDVAHTAGPSSDSASYHPTSVLRYRRNVLGRSCGRWCRSHFSDHLFSKRTPKT